MGHSQHVENADATSICLPPPLPHYTPPWSRPWRRLEVGDGGPRWRVGELLPPRGEELDEVLALWLREQKVQPVLHLDTHCA
jgi:hypothetical protein